MHYNEGSEVYTSVHIYFMKTELCIHFSVNYTIIGSDNGLLPVQQQPII